MKKLCTFILVISILVTFSPPPIAYAAVPSDFVSCWDLDEASGVRADENTSNGNDLTDNNTVTSETGVVSDAATHVAANSEYLSITDASQSGLDITGDMSFSLWLKYASLPANESQMVSISKWGGAGEQSFYQDNYYSGGNYNLRFIKRNAAGTAANATYASSTITTGVWYHIVGRFDATAQSLQIKINDAYIGTDATAQTDIDNSTADFRTGQYLNAFYLDGALDIVEIYDRELTDAEVTDLYNSGSGVACDNRGAGGGGAAPVFQDLFWF